MCICRFYHMHRFTYPQAQSRYRTFLSPQGSLMLSFITWKGKHSDVFIVPFFFLLCIWLCWRLWSVATYVESWNTTLFFCWDSLWSFFKSANMGTFSPQTPLAVSTLFSWASFQASFQVPQLGFPMQGGWHLCSEGSHAMLPNPASKWKYFPALRRWEKILLFYFLHFYF